MTREEVDWYIDSLKLAIKQNCLDEKYIEAIEALQAEPDSDYKTLRIKLENAEDVIRGLKEELRDAREELRQRW